ALATEKLVINSNAGADFVQLAITAGGATEVVIGTGDDVDTVEVVGTAAATEQVTIRTGAGADTIRVGSTTTYLSDIQGLIDVCQYDTVVDDILNIYSGSLAGTVVDGRIGRTTLTGLGIEQEISYNRLGQLGVYLGDANEHLVVTALPEVASWEVIINMGGGDDTLTVGAGDGFWSSDMGRLAGFTLGITGGDGRDALVLDDHESIVARSGVLITDINVQNLGIAQLTTMDFESLDAWLNDCGNTVTVWEMGRPVTIESGASIDTFNIASMTAGPEWPLVIHAGAGGDKLNLGDASGGHDTIRATIRFDGGPGNEEITIYDLDDGGSLEAYGEEDVDFLYVDYMGGGQALFDGGEGADVLQVGWTAQYHTVAGDLSFYGGPGNDRAAIYQLQSTASVLFDGGAGDDELSLGRTVGETARLDYLDGPVIFEGGAGEDQFDIDGASGGSGSGVSMLTKAIPTGGGEAMAWASWGPTAAGLYWAAEHGTVVLGGTSNVLRLQATAPECKTLSVRVYGDSEFYIEAQAATLPHTALNDIHGAIALIDPEYNDWLRIDDRASADPLRASLTNSQFQTYDASGAIQATMTYTGFDGMDVYLGDASDELAVGSLDAYAAEVQFYLGGGDDLLELGREGTLSRLSAIWSDVIIFGQDGRDTVAFHDADNAGSRSVTFSGSTLSGLIPAGLSVDLGYVEQINAWLGSGADTVNMTFPGWDLRIDTGSGNDQINALYLEAGKTVQVLGGPGNDTLKMGDGTQSVFPSGTVEFWGGDGNDTAYLYRSPSGALFNFYGDSGDDTLVPGIVAPWDSTQRLLGWIEGAVCFYGGEGYDSLPMNHTVPGNVLARLHKSTTPNGDELAHFILESPDNEAQNMQVGLWYDAELVNFFMGNTYTSTDGTDVFIDATGPSTQKLLVQREGGAFKHFHVGTDLNVPLSAIHGQLVLSGGNSLLEIHAAGVHDGPDDMEVSWNGDPAVRRGFVTSRWFGGVSYLGTGTIQITPAAGMADSITVHSLQAITVSVQLLGVETADLVVLGQAIGSSHAVTVNGIKPIYAVPTAAGGGSMTRAEGTNLAEPVSVRDGITPDLATLTSDHGSLVGSGPYTWNYFVAGPLLQTIAFTATDTAGFQTRKLFDLVVTNVGPVANEDAYAAREQRELAGNVLANDTNVNDHPTVALISSVSHGTLGLGADGSFSYTSTPGFLGDDTFTYRVNDGLLDSNVATVTIRVFANNAPAAADDDLTGRLFLSISPDQLLGNDTDADGDEYLLKVVILTQPPWGDIVENDDGTFRYVPRLFLEEWGTQFTYAAFDGLAFSAPATVTLSPTTNARPIANDDLIGTVTSTARVITAADLTANDTDGDGDALGVLIKHSPAHGTLTAHSDGSWVYTPHAGFVGLDSFGYAATDGMKQSYKEWSDWGDGTTTVSIRVAPLLPAHTLAVNAAMCAPHGPLAGLSWAWAYPSLQDALDRAVELNADSSSDNDISTIWVAGGTEWGGGGIYVPSRPLDVDEPQSTTFFLVSHVTIVGGFEGVESSPSQRPVDENTGELAYETILSGDFQFDDHAAGVNEWNNAWTVVYANNVQHAGLDTLTITRSYGWDGSSFDQLDRWLGGGLHAESSTLTLRNVRVTGNSAVGGGGGIYQAGGTLRLDHVSVEDNWTWEAGGGLQHVGGDLIITDSVFVSNRADYGGGMHVSGGTATLVNVRVGGGSGLHEEGEGNYGGEQGGGIQMAGPIAARMTNVVIQGNESSRWGGGGLHVSGADATLEMINSLIAYNLYAGVHNAGATLTVQNSTIARNRSGGGVNSDANATTTLFNSVLAENWDDWLGHEDAIGTFSSSSAANLIGVAAADATGLQDGVNGNLVGDADEPLIAGLDGEFRLTSISPAVGIGDISLLATDRDDLDGDGSTTEPLPLDGKMEARVTAGRLNPGACQNLNAVPVAVTDGPYFLAFGQDLNLDASGSHDPDNSRRYDPFFDEEQVGIVGYEWDIGNGAFTFNDWIPTSTISWSDLSGFDLNTPIPVTLRVYDALGAASELASTTLTIDASVSVSGSPVWVGAAGAEIRVVVDGETVFQRPLATLFGGLTIIGDAQNQSLTIDFSGEDPLPPGGIHFSGGAGSDTLTIANGTFTHVINTFTGSGQGTIQLDDRPAITYTGLEPVDLVGNALTDLTINLPPGADHALVEDVTGEGSWRISSTDAIPTFEATSFSCPSHSLTINANDGDTVILAGFDPLFNTPNVAFTGTGGGNRFVLQAGERLPDVTALTLAGDAEWDLNGQVETIGSLSDAAGGTKVSLGSGQLVVGGSNTTTN
ncbi:MAG TPA: Ig-like domain-containing protein, partial [Candidatus Paceibacterota bacterium]|nr:Ig-like domain-containing protein [Candidatus Paceibacterota bacterium]